MLSLTYEITTALTHTDELISPPYDIAIVTISYGRVTKSPVWDTMMSKINMGWPSYAAVVRQACNLTTRLQQLHYVIVCHGASNHWLRFCLFNSFLNANSKINDKTPYYWSIVGVIGDRWIPLTKGQQSRFHMTVVFLTHHLPCRTSKLQATNKVRNPFQSMVKPVSYTVCS